MFDFINNNKKHIVRAVILFVFASNIIVWGEIFTKERESDMRTSVLNVGQGDSIFISSRDGTQILIDGGPNNISLSMLKDRMPFYDRTIDVVIATHPHKDHITGLIDIFQRYNVGTFIESGAAYNTAEYYELENLVQKSGARHIVLGRPAQMLFYDGARLKLLTPIRSFDGAILKNVHDADIISELDFHGRKILFMGDAEKKLEQQLMNQQITGIVDVLKVGHHGSKTSSSAEFLSVVRPTYAIISVGKNNYGHPNQGVLNRLVSFGAQVLRTDIVGTVDIDIQNGALQVSSAK